MCGRGKLLPLSSQEAESHTLGRDTSSQGTFPVTYLLHLGLPPAPYRLPITPCFMNPSRGFSIGGGIALMI